MLDSPRELARACLLIHLPGGRSPLNASPPSSRFFFRGGSRFDTETDINHAVTGHIRKSEFSAPCLDAGVIGGFGTY